MTRDQRRALSPSGGRSWFGGSGERLSSAHPGSQLAAVTVPIILMLTVAALAFAWRGHQRSIETADRESQLLAASASNDAERFLANRVETLSALTPAVVLQSGDLDQMYDYFTRVVQLTGFSEAGLVDVSGYAQTVGGADRLRSPLYIGDREHIMRALKTGEPAIGGAQISRVSGEPTVPIVVPVKVGSRVTSLIAGAVRLNGPKSTDLRFGNVEGLRVVDGRGNLAVVGNEGLRELRSVTSWPGYSTVRGTDSGVLRTTGVLGEPDRVVGFAAVHGSDWVALVDRPQAEVYGAARSMLQTEVGLSAIFAAVSLLFVAWAAVRLDAGAERFVLFIDTLTHDVGTPLTVIRAYSTRLQRTLRDDAGAVASVIEIERAGRRIERMVQGLSDLLGPGRSELDRTEIDLVRLVREMVTEYQLRTGRTLRYEPARRSMLGEWDGLRIERLIDNLLSNAIKYSGSDTEVLVELTIEQPAGRREAVLEVRDHGIGIPVAEQRSIWGRFRRGSNTAGVPGKGVGLASVLQIAQEHGGSVHLVSAPGKGTAVTVRLPWPEDEGGADEEDGADEAAVAPAAALPRGPESGGTSA